MPTTAGPLMFWVISLLIVPAWSAGGGDVQNRLAKWSQGKRIEVVMNDGGQLIGRLGLVHADAFVLEPDRRNGTARTLRFDQVRSVRGKMTRAKKWGIAAGVYAVLCAMGLVLGK